jgi:hypothetical protein
VRPEAASKWQRSRHEEANFLFSLLYFYRCLLPGPVRAFEVNATGWSRGLEVTGGGTGVVSHAGLALDLIAALEAKIAELDATIEAHLAALPGAPPACPDCGLIGGGHAPGCASHGTVLLSLTERLDEIPGVGPRTAQVIIAELGLDMAQFPTAGHASSWARLSPQTLQSGARKSPGT